MTAYLSPINTFLGILNLGLAAINLPETVGWFNLVVGVLCLYVGLTGMRRNGWV